MGEPTHVVFLNHVVCVNSLNQVCSIWRNTNAAFKISLYQFVIFNPLSYCFKEMIGFDVKASFASRPVLRLTRWYNKPGDITIDFSWIENYKLIYSCSYENNALKISHCESQEFWSYLPMKVVFFLNISIIV